MDVRHAVNNAMCIEDLDHDTRLYLGPARNLAFLEVVTLVSEGGREIVIHAMGMRSKYRDLLPGE